MAVKGLSPLLIATVIFAFGVKPEVTIDGPPRQFVVIGNGILLTCHYKSSPTPAEVQWKKDGTVISRNASIENFTQGSNAFFNGSLVQLRINASTSEVAGNYRCLVINSVHNSSAAATISIIVQVVPDPPQDVLVEAKRSRVVNISWRAGFDGNSVILYYTVEISEDNQTFNGAKCQGLSNGTCVVSGSSTSASLEGLFPWTTYFIKVFATNKVGRSLKSSVVETTTDEEAPSTAPAFSVTVLNSTAVNVSWQMLTKEQARGAIQGYFILYKKMESPQKENRTVLGKDTTSYLVTSLEEFVWYMFSMQASNSKGVSAKSKQIERKTDQDKPDGAPQNVRGYNTSSTSILVSWDEVQRNQRNGIITSYTITYQSQTENHNGNVPVAPYDRQKSITGLKEYVDYDITVFASTVKGDGPHSSPVLVLKTDQDKPDGAPQNVSGYSINSTSILVLWDEVPADQQNGIITGYTITYQSQTENHNGNVPAEANDRQKNITGLKEYVDYNITVFASTLKGDGPHSSPALVVKTDQDKPSASPDNLQGHNTSSTSILVQWGEVPAADQNGIILSYTVTYKALPNGSPQTEVVNAPTRQATLTGLNEYTNYNITVFASTVKGDGYVSSPIIVITDEDRPNAPPDNVQGHYTSSSSIVVQWGEVPSADQNGIIRSYTVTYKALPGSSPQIKVVNAPTRQATLTGLNEYTIYIITVFASTGKGDGNVSNPIVVIKDENKEAKQLQSKEKSPTVIIITVVVVLLVLLIIVCVIIIWRRRSRRNETKTSSRYIHDDTKEEIIEMLENQHLSEETTAGITT